MTEKACWRPKSWKTLGQMHMNLIMLLARFAPLCPFCHTALPRPKFFVWQPNLLNNLGCCKTPVQGSLYVHQPKQCTLMREISQNNHIFHTWSFQNSQWMASPVYHWIFCHINWCQIFSINIMQLKGSIPTWLCSCIPRRDMLTSAHDPIWKVATSLWFM